jgi:hypothetical protein
MAGNRIPVYRHVTPFSLAQTRRYFTKKNFIAQLMACKLKQPVLPKHFYQMTYEGGGGLISLWLDEHKLQD